MQSAALNAAYDFEHPHRDPNARVRLSEVLEYIDAFSIDNHPCHPTTAIHWDLIRTFGESEGRRLLLRASRRWDATPLEARDIVFKAWEDDYAPRAWVDEYLVEVIDSWRSECARLRRCERAKQEWLAFCGYATWQEISAWQRQHGAWYVDPHSKHGPVTRLATASQVQFARDMRTGRIPNPSALPPEAAMPEPRLGFGGHVIPFRAKFRRK